MDKFLDAKQVLELKDSIIFGDNELVISTIMLDEPKVVHGRKYWFETYIIELDPDGKMIFGKLNNQYLTSYEAIQGHKLSFINYSELIIRAKATFEKPNQVYLSLPTKKDTESLDKH